MSDWVGFFILVALAILFAWLTRRAWKSKRAVLKWVGVLLGGLLTLILAFLCITAAIGLYKLHAPRGSPAVELKIAGTPDQIARGEHLASIVCAKCHSPNDELPLSGGPDIAADLPLPLGHFYSVNLTPAGPLKDWSDGEILRVLSEGVDRTGRPLLVMSSAAVRYLSGEDKQAVIAYLRSQPPVMNDIPDPPDQPNLLAAILAGAGIIEFRSPLTGTITAPPKAATADYGKYIVAYGDCQICHGENLAGGTNPTTPHGPNLCGMQGWTQEQFIATIRTGKDPSGHQLSTVMPWKEIARLDDVELDALYAYLKSLPPDHE